MDDGRFVLEFGAKAAVAHEFNVNPKAVYNVWSEGLQSLADGAESMTLTNRLYTGIYFPNRELINSSSYFPNGGVLSVAELKILV